MPENAFGQMIGDPVPDWVAPPRPSRCLESGHYAQIEPLESREHLDDLFASCCPSSNDSGWTYLPYGPFADRLAYGAWLETIERSDDPLFFAIRELGSGRVCGLAAYLRISPAAGSIEIGHLHFGPVMRRTPVATDALRLMIERSFALGYRRLEWKCDALNAPSMAAAKRLGFSFEGIFRQAAVVHGRNRDTAWFSILDWQWPALRVAFETWLDAGNFDAQGRQQQSLSDLTRAVSQAA